jgi:hypothetical protein
MNRTTRLLWIGAAVVVLVIAVIVVKPGGSSDNAASTGPVTVDVKDFKPVGGIKTLTVKKGQHARYTINSDEAEEIHTHGYNIAKDVGPGAPAKFDFVANIDGVFVVELEHHGTQIMSLKVEP